MKTVVLFGDSLTDFFPMEMLEDENIRYINSGIAGQTLPEMKIRIREDIVSYAPDEVYMQGGANDYLSPVYRGASIVARQLVEIGKKTKEMLPNAKVYVESLYPVYTKRLPGDIYSWAEGKSNEEIKRINHMVKAGCEEHGLLYVDMFTSLVSESGELAIEDTVDGVHLSQSGYEKVMLVLNKYL